PPSGRWRAARGSGTPTACGGRHPPQSSTAGASRCELPAGLSRRPHFCFQFPWHFLGSPFLSAAPGFCSPSVALSSPPPPFSIPLALLGLAVLVGVAGLLLPFVGLDDAGTTLRTTFRGWLDALF